MYILGINNGHDSSAAIIKDAEIIADVQEERFVRLKHSSNVPVKSILYCLEAAGLDSINDVDYIAIAGNDTPMKLAIILDQKQKANFKKFAKEILKVFGMQLGTTDMKPPIYHPDLSVSDTSKIINVEHHLAHAASAHYTRKTGEKCLVFTIDGAGDNISTAVWEAEGNKIKPLEKLFREASIGWAYSIVTEGLHWWHGDGEGKTMGLAPYGDYNKCKGILDDFFPVIKDGKIIRESQLGVVSSWTQSGSFQWHFDEAFQVEKLCEKYGRENVAAEAQRKLEENIMEYVFGWIKKTGIKRTAYSGGVFLNVKLNQKIWYARGDKMTEQHIFPNAGDSGLAVGAALKVFYRHNRFHGINFKNLFYGPEYSDSFIEKLVKDRKLGYELLDDPSITAAEMLAEGKILGWFQGRMESGPRALGNRSILMATFPSENKDIINARVKFREAFRPFCPSLLYEKKDEYLVDARDEYFMITSFDVNHDVADKMPAVVHCDGTLRPQLVKKEINEKYYNLIKEFGNRTGTYVVLNTSFNIKGEPIINTPSEAIRCFYDSGLDALIMGNVLLKKKEV